jgi:glucosylceramidase
MPELLLGAREGLARFISSLGPEMQTLGVDVFFGTRERPNGRLVDVPLLDPKSSGYIKRVGMPMGR